MAYKKLIKVSNVCQLLDKSKYPATQTIGGVTFTNNGDGTITVNGTASDMAQYFLCGAYQFDLSVIKNHKYLLIITDIDHNFNFVFGGAMSGLGYYEGRDKYIIVTASDTMDGKCYAIIRIEKGKTCNNEIAKPQFFDLTEMYGAGHEPTTVEQFRQDFPDEMYDYSPHCWLTSYKRVFLTGGGNYLTSYQRNLTCKTKNLLPYPYHDGAKTLNGITFTDNGNGTINLSGTSTRQVNFYFSYGTLNLKKGVTYTLSASGDYSYSGSFTFYIYNSTYGKVCDIPLASSKSASFTPTQDINDTNCYIVIPSDRTVSGTLKPMLELGSTATDYVPYGHL